MRMTVERAEAICAEYNFKLSNGVYVDKLVGCGCAIGLMAVDKCGGVNDVAQHIGNLAADYSYPEVAERLGEPVEYVAGLEAGFEGSVRASLGPFGPEVERNEDFWRGVLDGGEIFYACQRGQLPGQRQLGNERRALLIAKAVAALEEEGEERAPAFAGATSGSA